MSHAFLEPWVAVKDSEREPLENELRNELGSAHVLFGLKATALGQRCDQDDVLFVLEDGRVADVHLTYRRDVPEPDPRWPHTTLYSSLSEWMRVEMIRAHEDWAGPQGPYKLQSLPVGWFLVAYSININRHLVRLSATVDIRGRLETWRRHLAAGSTQARGPLIADDTRGRLEVFAGSALIDAFEFPLETPFPQFDRLPDGRWVVSDARCPVGERNARILAADGTLLSRICLGDAIAYLQCDCMGGIWIGYFDEGVFGNFGWNSDGNPAPLGAGGISRFAADGAISWSPGPDFHPPIYDCYAMNVSTDGVWLCYYDGFPVVHVPFDGVLRQWRNDTVRGASLIAADGNSAVLLGGYQDEAGTGALLRLNDDGRSEVLHRFRLGAALHGAMREGFAIARGSEIHFVSDDTWHVISVGDFAAGLAQSPPLHAPYVPPPQKEKPK